MALLPSLGLCLLGLVVLNPFLAAEASRCPRDWLHHRGNCYGYFDAQKSWQDAVIECQSYSRRSYLASVLSREESPVVAGYVSRRQKVAKDVWIGLSDVEQSRVWRWTDESSFNYEAWKDGEPNNQGGNEYCVELVRSKDFRQWNDVNCEKRNSFICKYSLATGLTKNAARHVSFEVTGVKCQGTAVLEDASSTS